jgi:CheY-like chemotaxis protein
MQKVLIVEDEKYRYDRWRREFDNKVMLIFAPSIEEAEEQFAASPDIAAIVMDACVPGDSPTTPPLVRKFRQTFTGPMIAISSVWEYRLTLVRAGCDHESTKDAMPAKVLEVLGL